MFTEQRPPLPHPPAVLQRANGMEGRIAQLESQVDRLAEHNAALVHAVRDWADTLNRDGVLHIYQALITASHGIQFPATQNPSSDANTLDDYEEAPNWTPVASFATVGTSVWTPTIQVADATKIGRDVFINFRFNGTVVIGTGAGNLQITGCPYTPSSDANFVWDGPLAWGNLTPAGGRTQVVATMVAGSSTILFTSSGTAAAAAVVQAAEVTGALALRGSIRFRV